MSFDHEPVCHREDAYVRGEVHTNGIESFWSMLKRAHKGTYHQMSPKHLNRYVAEFTTRHNMCDANTVNQMVQLTGGLAGKHLKYEKLVA